jgi:hypothetical protein
MFTTGALYVHPAGMEAYLLNFGGAPPTPNNGGIYRVRPGRKRPFTLLYL